jgi:phosphoribosylformylglycinamidine (FGAM) synthase-like enzyme
MVQTNTTVGPGAGDAVVLRLKDSKRALAIKTDGNGRWCWLAPRLGAMHAVAEAARNVACTGARPIAATNCLNFGNPEKPEVMWQFSEAVGGIAEACRILQIPITGGNVSFYNETLGRAIYPTPVLGVLGLIEDAARAVGSGFRNEGDAIVLLDASGKFSAGARAMFWKNFHETQKANPDWGALEKRVGSTAEEWRAFSSSEYAKEIQGGVAGGPPAIDLVAEKKLIECLVALAAEGAILSAHDVSDGGLAVTLAESCFTGNNLGADVTIMGEELPEPALFGERGARAIVSVSPASLARLNEIAAQYGVAAQRVGNVTRGEFRIQYNGAIVIKSGADILRRAWSDSLARTIENV